MKPLRILVAFTVALVGALMFDTFLSGRARALTIVQPPGTLIEGIGTCGGPPTTGYFPIYSGTQWCDSNKLPGAGVQWNNGADLTEVNAPRSIIGGFVTGGFTAITAGTTSDYKATVAMHIRAFDIALQQSPLVCTTYGTVDLIVNGSGQASSNIAMGSGFVNGQVGSLSIAVAAGQTIQVGLAVAPSSCGTLPGNMNWHAEVTTD